MTARLTLRDLGDEVLALDDLAALDDGEWTPELEQLAAELAEKLVPKVDAFAGYIRELEATEEAIAAEIARLSARKKATGNRVTWLKRYAVDVLQRTGRPRMEGDLFTIACQKNPDRVDVQVLPDALPAEFVRVIPEQREPDRAALLKALKAGAVIDGVAIAPPSYHLRVR